MLELFLNHVRAFMAELLFSLHLCLFQLLSVFSLLGHERPPASERSPASERGRRGRPGERADRRPPGATFRPGAGNASKQAFGGLLGLLSGMAPEMLQNKPLDASSGYFPGERPSEESEVASNRETPVEASEPRS